jgi:acyl carrier protein
MFEEIRAHLKAEVAGMTELPVDEIDVQAHLGELGIDSLQALELLVAIERTYHIEVPEEELAEFTSINSVAELVDRHVRAVVLA